MSLEQGLEICPLLTPGLVRFLSPSFCNPLCFLYVYGDTVVVILISMDWGRCCILPSAGLCFQYMGTVLACSVVRGDTWHFLWGYRALSFQRVQACRYSSQSLKFKIVLYFVWFTYCVGNSCHLFKICSLFCKTSQKSYKPVEAYGNWGERTLHLYLLAKHSHFSDKRSDWFSAASESSSMKGPTVCRDAELNAVSYSA